MLHPTRTVFTRLSRFLLTVTACTNLSKDASCDDIEIPRSVAHRSNYTRTATEAEIAETLDLLKLVDRTKFNVGPIGQSNKALPIQSVLIDPLPNPEHDHRPLTVVVIGGIHSGECAGKEAMLELLREIALGNHPAWHESLRIVFIPSLNPDGNSRRALDNRPGQVGPIEGMGTRENALGLDLNRDFIKLEAPEIRSLVSLCHTLDADVLIDLHTTNGSQHRYELTYDPPHHPATPAAIREFLRGEFLPTITKHVYDRDSLSFFYYGNFDRGHTRWSTYGYEGRYGTNYMGLRGRIGILSEAYSYADYETRVRASKAFVGTILDGLATDSAKIRGVINQNPFTQALANGHPSTSNPENVLKIPLTATLEAFPEPIIVKGFASDTKATDPGAIHEDYRVEYFGDFRTAISTNTPLGYFIPTNDPSVIELLARHGIASQKLTITEPWLGEHFMISQCEIAERPFQGHHLVRLEGDWEPVTLSAGTVGYWVAARGPLVPLMATILEPQSADSVATWNIIAPDRLAIGNPYPIVRIMAQKQIAEPDNPTP